MHHTRVTSWSPPSCELWAASQPACWGAIRSCLAVPSTLHGLTRIQTFAHVPLPLHTYTTQAHVALPHGIVLRLRATRKLTLQHYYTRCAFYLMAQCPTCMRYLPQAYSKAHPEHKAGEAQAKVVLWGPKLQGTKEGNEYDPRTKDWASVGCRGVRALSWVSPDRPL